MPRHTQPDRLADDTSQPCSVSIAPHAQTYTTRQTWLPNHQSRHQPAHRVCPDKHNATDRTVRGPTHTTRVEWARMTVPNVAKGHCARIRSHNDGRVGPNDCAEHCQASPCEDPLTHCRVRRHGPEYRAVQKGRCVRIHSHNGGRAAPDQGSRHCRGALCED